MKQILDLRPVYHRREDRIRAHVLLCWLALLLIRVAETSTGQTWNRLRTELQRLHSVTYRGPAGTARQPTDLTKPQHDVSTGVSARQPAFPTLDSTTSCGTPVGAIRVFSAALRPSLTMACRPADGAAVPLRHGTVVGSPELVRKQRRDDERTEAHRLPQMGDH
ncbi:hypothetical protein OG528_30160 [Streptomyces platensis]|uniref:hypothetical protein n=1 Tax=Streptomyces platensis TaxID=58346 RepID=UPI0030E074CC